MNNTGEILKNLRLKNNLTLEELANNLNTKYGCKLNKGMISKWESGKSEPRFEYAKYLANYFNVSLDFLLDAGSLEIGEAIKEEMEYQGISKKELSNSIGISEDEVQKYVTNEVAISSVVAEKIANVFGMSLAKFLYKYDLYNDYIPPQFGNDVDAYEKFKAAVDIDVINENKKQQKEIDTIAAHLDGKNITPQKLKLLEKYIDALFDEDED
jgi:repressor LexA